MKNAIRFLKSFFARKPKLTKCPDCLSVNSMKTTRNHRRREDTILCRVCGIAQHRTF